MSDSENIRKIINLVESTQSRKYITEGVWAWPQSIESAQKLYQVMQKPIPASEAGRILNKLVGDDDLFDSIADDVKVFGKNTDVRIQVASTLRDWLENLDNFFEPWDPRAVKIIQKLVDEID